MPSNCRTRAKACSSAGYSFSRASNFHPSKLQSAAILYGCKNLVPKYRTRLISCLRTEI